MKLRIGYGFDVHRLSEGYDLWLGGVKIPAEKGAVGHSDADVVLHAICDAMLGALSLRDIGFHFPDTSSEFKGIDSKILLKRTFDLIKEKGFRVNNIDAMLCLEKPKIKPHIDAMRESIAAILEVTADDISIKATTNEKLGYVGREEGITASAVVLLIAD
ncbi:MAG: 2-C-methyl-D-erythritol 2,4-cyclodiphosphate synthase [Flavobacteriales bacterium]|nr:2-C-methyl-D-erythritol 2,4-cyclodiphosphate synthase [Flavobacteriales bacterium]